jgi:hypothetical protein
MSLGTALLLKCARGRATDWTRGFHRLPNPDKLRMLVHIDRSEAAGAKARGREGNNPDHQLRSLNIC